MNWRAYAASIIHEVIARVGRDDEKTLRKALWEAYPFGERRYHPHKIWHSEVNRQLGTPKTVKLDPRQTGFEV